MVAASIGALPVIEYRTEECRRLNPWTFEATCNHKPLSINRAHYKNKRKTRDYLDYEDAWGSVLSGHRIPEDHCEDWKTLRFRVDYEWGFSNRAADVDNPIKPATDIMQNWFKFNDKQILVVKATKFIVPKGSEYAKVKILEIFEDDFIRLQERLK